MSNNRKNGSCLYCGKWDSCPNNVRNAIGTVCAFLALDEDGTFNHSYQRSLEGELFSTTAKNCRQYEEAKHEHNRLMTVIARQDVDPETGLIE